MWSKWNTEEELCVVGREYRRTHILETNKKKMPACVVGCLLSYFHFCESTIEAKCSEKKFFFFLWSFFSVVDLPVTFNALNTQLFCYYLAMYRNKNDKVIDIGVCVGYGIPSSRCRHHIYSYLFFIFFAACARHCRPLLSPIMHGGMEVLCLARFSVNKSAWVTIATGRRWVWFGTQERYEYRICFGGACVYVRSLFKLKTMRNQF